DFINEIEVDSRILSSDRSGQSGSTPWSVIDNDVQSGFRTGYLNWQYVRVDFGRPVVISGLRRNMRGAGFDRGRQGEKISYSNDGTTWTFFSSDTATGWEDYNNYRPSAWHSVRYGWSAWIRPRSPISARYVRFHWDGNNDELNEVEIDSVQDVGDRRYDFPD